MKAMYGLSCKWKTNLSCWKHLVTIRHSAGLKQDSSRMTFCSTHNSKGFNAVGIKNSLANIGASGYIDELMTEELRAFSDPTRRQQTFLACLGNKEKASIVETIFDLYESEVRKIMLNIREEALRNVFSVVDPKRIVAALGEEKVIAALGDEKIIAALDKKKLQAALTKEDLLAAANREEMINALAGNESFLKALLAKLDAEQLRKMLEEKTRH